jgi:hypothetical protein
MTDPKKTEADIRAGKEVSGAKRTIAPQYEGLAADAALKQAKAQAATESVNGGGKVDQRGVAKPGQFAAWA